MHWKALFDQFDDLRDAYCLGQITREEFVKRMEVLTLDHRDAQTEAKLIEEANQEKLDAS